MQQGLRRSAQGDRAHLQHIGAVGHLQGGAGVLLYQQHRHAEIAQRSDHLQDLAHDQRRQAQRRLVEHQQARLGHEGAANRQHLPLAARERERHLRAALLQARKDGKDFLHARGLVALTLAPAPKAAQQQVVFDRHLAEQLALFRHQRDAGGHHHLHRGPDQRSAVQRQRAARGQQAHGRAQQRGLAGAVRPDHGDDLAFIDRQRQLVHGLHRAIGHAEVRQFQQPRAHAAACVSKGSSMPPR